jgi:hypothetical protein
MGILVIGLYELLGNIQLPNSLSHPGPTNYDGNVYNNHNLDRQTNVDKTKYTIEQYELLLLLWDQALREKSDVLIYESHASL